MDKKEDMMLIEHLTELRKRLVVIGICNVVVAMLLFRKAELVMDYLLAINPGMQLVYINPSELLLVYIQLSFLMALIVCFPINVYEIWAFIEKGLYKKEKIYILSTLIFGVICFIGGIVFCYTIVLPTTLEFFMRIAITEVAAMISVKSYVSFVNVMLLAFGCVFEMPVLVYLLTRLELIKPEFLKSNRGLIIVLIFIFAAIITPPDVVSQTMLAIPMVLLMELSIFICIVVDKSNNKRCAKDMASDSI